MYRTIAALKTSKPAWAHLRLKSIEHVSMQCRCRSTFEWLASFRMCVMAITVSFCFTATSASTPSLQISRVNTETVKKCEKFEIHLELAGVGIQNPNR